MDKIKSYLALSFIINNINIDICFSLALILILLKIIIIISWYIKATGNTKTELPFTL